MHKWYIFSQLVVPTRPPHSAHNSRQDILNICTQLFNFLTLILLINIPHDVWIVENIYIYICVCVCKQLHLGRMHISLYYSATAHPEDGQVRPKHVDATNWENISFVRFVFFLLGKSLVWGFRGRCWIILKWTWSIAWNDFIYLRIWTSGQLLLLRYSTLGCRLSEKSVLHNHRHESYIIWIFQGQNSRP